MTEPSNSRWLPGTIAIGSLYILLAGGAVPSLWAMPHTRQVLLQLVFCVGLAAGGAGLLAMRRWGWALCAAGAVVLVFVQCFAFYMSHVKPALALAAANLVIFLYLIRPEVRMRLR